MKIIRARRIAVTAAAILVAYVLQCAVFPALAVANIKPNLMLIITASFRLYEGAEGRNVCRDSIRASH